ncbi:hypothetical protein [Sphingobium lactosutens]|uniref:Uncharacterized protein n=1 Tax=Sphingobium lactosutens DS20 TaxID=1331060 RepID=T0HM58_9SPHN|nr:hypothetical protein [Sphingobium lactosutens]EQB13253.1 hypothetical protein RLDS_16070 [Sphingobium lactosutens DS20]
MTTYSVDVTVEEMLAALNNAIDRRGLETFAELNDGLQLEVEATIDEDLFYDRASDLGYVHEDEIMDGYSPEARDLEDGLRSLIQGDRGTAVTLLQRAFSEWPDAMRVVEDVLLARTVHDRRQGALALAA